MARIVSVLAGKSHPRAPAVEPQPYLHERGRNISPKQNTNVLSMVKEVSMDKDTTRFRVNAHGELASNDGLVILAVVLGA